MAGRKKKYGYTKKSMDDLLAARLRLREVISVEKDREDPDAFLVSELENLLRGFEIRIATRVFKGVCVEPSDLK